MLFKKYSVKFRGEEFIGNTVEGIARSISKSKGIPVSEIILYVQDNMKLRKSKISEPNFNIKGRRKVSLTEAAHGAASAMKQIGGDSVDPQEILRRSAICQSCPKRSNISGCSSCEVGGKLMQFVNKIKKSFGTPVDIPNNLSREFCGVCECSLGMMIPAPLNHFHTSTIEDKNRPKFCWLKKGPKS
jgi:hypothetical protein